MGDLDIAGVHPGDPYDALVLLYRNLKFRAPTPAEALQIVRGLGWSNLRPPPVPPQETLPRWRRTVEGLRHSMGRDAEAIHHHYDVSNRFYELVLGPSMTYTCAVFPHEDATPRGGPGLQVRPGRPQARPQARHAAARRRLRLGRHGPLRGPRVRRQGARRDALGRAGVVGQAGHRPRGPGRPRRGAPLRLPRRARGRLRRDQLDRADRAHRRAAVPRLLRVPQGQAAPAGPAAQPLHHPPPQPPPGDRCVHRPLRLPRRRADRRRAGSSPRRRTSASR